MKLAKRISRLGTETAFEVLAKARRLESEGMDVIHLEIGEPDFDTAPHIIESARQALQSGYTHYGPSPGLANLRDTIAQDVSSTRGVTVTSDNVVVTPGGKPIMFFVIMALVDPDDEVLYPNPGFPIYESMIKFVGGIPVPMRLYESKGFNIDIEEVERQITEKTKLVILNSPNNPCGSVINKQDITKLSELIKKTDITVLSDEIYNRFLYEGDHESIYSIPGMSDRTVLLDGFSKSYAMTGWRIGYGVMPKELIEPMSRLVTNSVSCTASFTQIAAIDAISGSQEYTRSMVAEFKNRRNLIVSGLNSFKGIRCAMPEGAFYVFPNVEGTGITSKQFAERLLEEAGVACLAGESFGEFGKGHVRFSFANSSENIQHALERIKAFVATM